MNSPAVLVGLFVLGWALNEIRHARAARRRIGALRQLADAQLVTAQLVGSLSLLLPAGAKRVYAEPVGSSDPAQQETSPTP
jgi:hypothetical protein